MKDVLIQLSSVDFQENNINDQNTTNVFLGKCKDILKEKYNLKDNEILLMLKLDLFKKTSSTALVEYEIYNYNNSQKLNLDYCNNVMIDVYVPIQLDNKTIFLYNNLNSSGYNLFDINDSFYIDICSLYTTINGTDITLVDRQNEYYNKSLIICKEEGCTYDYYDTKLNKIKCECPISKTSKGEENKNMENQNNFISTIVDIYNNKDTIRQIFSLSIDNMNFKVMKCYNLIFSLNIFKNNIGCILLTILIIFYLVLMVLYLTIGNKFLKDIINSVAFNKHIFNNNKNPNKCIRNDFKNKTRNKENEKIIKNINYTKTKKINKKVSFKKGKNQKITNGKKSEINNISIQKLKSENNKLISNKNISIFQMKKNKQSNSKIKQTKLKNNCNPPKNTKSQTRQNLRNEKKYKTISDNGLIFKNIKNCHIDTEIKNKKEVKCRKNIFKISKKSLDSNNSELLINKGNSFINQKNKKSYNISLKEKANKEINQKLFTKNNINNKLLKKEKLKDVEMNELNYRNAIMLDKRTFFQYYFCLLKKKILIIFVFYFQNDYNVRIIKISLFIVSFSLYMTINGFFFTDSTMHKVYENNGNYNIIYQIPQILYSSIISLIINNLLQYLSLSEKSILNFKKHINKKDINVKSKEIQKCLNIKLNIYFLLGFLLMLFFWYFISTFCAVYSNTQIILLKNTVICFLVSMIYPIGYALLPGLFRIPALRAKNQDQECIYKFSKLLAYL